MNDENEDEVLKEPVPAEPMKVDAPEEEPLSVQEADEAVHVREEVEQDFESSAREPEQPVRDPRNAKEAPARKSPEQAAREMQVEAEERAGTDAPPHEEKSGDGDDSTPNGEQSAPSAESALQGSSFLASAKAFVGKHRRKILAAAGAAAAVGGAALALA